MRFTLRQGRPQKPTEKPRQPDRHPAATVGRQGRKGDGGEESEVLLPDWWDLDENATADDYMDNVEQWK